MKSKKKMEEVYQLRLTKDEKKHLFSLAKEDGLTVAEVLRKSLELYLTSRKRGDLSECRNYKASIEK